MTPAVEAAFGAFIERITPSPDAIQLGKTRAERVVNLLKQGFTVKEALASTPFLRHIA